MTVLFVLFIVGVSFAQLSYDKEDKTRTIPPGKGQVFTESFHAITDFHFVQFGVYPFKGQQIDKIKAPKQAGQVWLILHTGTTIKGMKDNEGAYYIVKPYLTDADAKAAAKAFSEKGIKCWYNPDLTKASFTLIGATKQLTQ